MGLGTSAVLRTSTGIPGWAQITVNFTTPVGCTSIGVYALRDSGSGVDILLWGASLQVAGGGPELITNPNAIGGAGWGVSNITATLNYGTDPLGGGQASRAVDTVAGHYLREDITVSASTNYTFKFWAKNNGGTVAKYSVFNFSSPADIVAPTSYFSQLP